MIIFVRVVRTHPDIFENSVFVSVLAAVYNSTGKQRLSGAENAGFQKRSSEWRGLETPDSRLPLDGPKRRFSNTLMSYTILLLELHRISIVLAFSCGRVKSI